MWDDRTRTWSGGRYLAGGSPWGLTRSSPAARDVVRHLRAAGPVGVVAGSAVERELAVRLVARGYAHPLVVPRPPAEGEVSVVVPAYGRPELLDRCLRALDGLPVIVVDDGSPEPAPVRQVAERHGARLLRLPRNRGPAAARNAGFHATGSPLVAFVDSDCVVAAGWLEHLVPLFAWPEVGAVAPRVRPRLAVDSLLARHEDARSALDMGTRRELVCDGARLGFLPSAALVVRREAFPPGGFDERMRVGEDVDLVFRLGDAGHQVRYEPASTVHHETRLRPVAWARRRYEYGTSAAPLDRRHPRRLAPARLSGWNLATGALLLARRPVAAGLTSLAATGTLAAALCRGGAPPAVAARIVAMGLVADGAAIGHALRREWWPLGWAALAAAGRSRAARAGTALMLASLVLEHVRDRPRVDPVRYVLLRLVEDAAYGSGVLTSAVRERRPRVLVPTVRWPRRPARRAGQPDATARS